VLLFVAATILSRTFWNLEHFNPGFDRAHVVEFNIDPWDAGYSETQAGLLLRELKQRESEIPGVRAVGFANMGLMRGIGTKATVTPQGTILPEKTFLNTSTNGVTTNYFESLGIPLIAGRNLEVSDAAKAPVPIVVNRAFAEFFFPHQNAVGKAVVQGVDGTKPPTAVLVGMVGTAKYRSLREQDPPIYYSLADDKNPGGMMYVRTYGDPAQIINATRGILRRLAPNVPIVEAFTLEQEVQNSLWQERLVTILCAFFGITALLLSATGLYGGLAYSVTRRSRELGIRVAIGAQTRHILETVCLRMIVSVGLGLLGGVLCSAGVMRLAASLLFGVPPDDPLSLALAAAVLLLCICFAAAPPTWRATKTDPALALRAE
jgi:predicted permease